MVRTQIQLTPEQARRLRKLAAARNRSIAELVRDGVDRVLAEAGNASRGDRMRRAARVFGRFRSRTRGLSGRHDDEFADAAGARR